MAGRGVKGERRGGGKERREGEEGRESGWLSTDFICDKRTRIERGRDVSDRIAVYCILLHRCTYICTCTYSVYSTAA